MDTKLCKPPYDALAHMLRLLTEKGTKQSTGLGWNKRLRMARDMLDLIDRCAEREHASSPACWCAPTVEYRDPDTGAEVWVHKKPQ